MAAEPTTISGLSRALQQRAVTATAVTEQCLARIAGRDRAINAFITVLADEALAQAQDADREIAAGRYRGPLHGVPVSLKDIIDQQGTPTTVASHVRDGHVAAGDAVVTARLRSAGAVLLGKTNLHEFALGTTNEESAYGPVHHPLDATRSPGGSSGGSAAAVLDGMSWASIGTDTGGSVRIPAAACGLVGLKPTVSEIPTEGVVPLSRTLDHVGPLCRSVADASLVFDVLRGATMPVPVARGMRGLRFGVPRPYFFDLLDPDVRARVEETCTRIREAGGVLEDVAVGHTKEIGAIYVHLALPEAAAYHATTLEAIPGAYTPNVRLRLEMGRSILAEDYVRAQRGREVLIAEVDRALRGHDALILPTLPIAATTLGVPTVTIDGTEETVRNLTLRLTQLFNITGHPAVSVPCGATREGLPVGIQIVGARHCTPELLQVAAEVEALC